MKQRQWLGLLKDLADEFDRHVVFRKNTHTALICNRGDRGKVFCSGTPSDTRSIHRVRQDLKKMEKKDARH